MGVHGGMGRASGAGGVRVRVEVCHGWKRAGKVGKGGEGRVGLGGEEEGRKRKGGKEGKGRECGRQGWWESNFFWREFSFLFGGWRIVRSDDMGGDFGGGDFREAGHLFSGEEEAGGFTRFPDFEIRDSDQIEIWTDRFGQVKIHIDNLTSSPPSGTVVFIGIPWVTPQSGFTHGYSY